MYARARAHLCTFDDINAHARACLCSLASLRAHSDVDIAAAAAAASVTGRLSCALEGQIV